jgi:hypothetical protein
MEEERQWRWQGGVRVRLCDNQEEDRVRGRLSPEETARRGSAIDRPIDLASGVVQVLMAIYGGQWISFAGATMYMNFLTLQLVIATTLYTYSIPHQE